jgi:hypothetical protein
VKTGFEVNLARKYADSWIGAKAYRGCGVIKNESDLRQTFEQLERMQRALASLRDEVLPVNPRLFAVMAEGPLDYIREFHDDLEAFRLSLLGPIPKQPV